MLYQESDASPRTVHASHRLPLTDQVAGRVDFKLLRTFLRQSGGGGEVGKESGGGIAMISLSQMTVFLTTPPRKSVGLRDGIVKLCI